MTVYRLTKELVFPPPELADDDGLLAVGGDLSVDRLVLAYSMGIFPWYSGKSPILGGRLIHAWSYFRKN